MVRLGRYGVYNTCAFAVRDSCDIMDVSISGIAMNVFDRRVEALGSRDHLTESNRILHASNDVDS